MSNSKHNNRCDNGCIYFDKPTSHQAACDYFKIIGSCRGISSEETEFQITESNKTVIDTIGCATYAQRNIK